MLAAFGILAGSALGNWIAWSAAPALASSEAAESLVAQVVSSSPIAAPIRHDVVFGSTGDGAWGALLGGKRFEPGAVCFPYAMTVPQLDGAVVAADLGLRSNGWTVTSGGDPAHRLVAERDDRRLEISTRPCAGRGDVAVRVMRAEPPSAMPAAFSGGLLGGLVGWFAGVALARRRPRPALLFLGFLGLVPAVGAWAIVVLGRLDGEAQQAPLWAPFGEFALRPAAFAGILLILAAVITRQAQQASPVDAENVGESASTV
jgi:hypothetical protein